MQVAELRGRLDGLSSSNGQYLEALERTSTNVRKEYSQAIDRLGYALEEKLRPLNAKVDAIDGKVDALTGRVDALAGRVDALAGRVDALDGKVLSVFSAAAAVAATLTIIAGFWAAFSAPRLPAGLAAWGAAILGVLASGLMLSATLWLMQNIRWPFQ